MKLSAMSEKIKIDIINKCGLKHKKLCRYKIRLFHNIDNIELNIYRWKLVKTIYYPQEHFLFKELEDMIRENFLKRLKAKKWC
ncbi:hypothetical protein HZI73_26260 (plasmid) [Vallitalea pronyensis]|uniref:Uncharacterized protein n=1 Tax=Vallitalea pronyensis TaxID=1348613 RepID=A0A8J8SJV5_9FIRM|nr:hypothetical protein [Vallitalea pronyensis]QUI25919.1 hypothetical protein HZI73_26260 [Vallitalea pronyensis]